MKGFWTHKNSAGRKQSVKITFKLVLPLWKSKGDSKVRTKSPAISPEDFTQTLKPNRGKSNTSPLDFRTIMNQLSLSYSLFPPTWVEYLPQLSETFLPVGRVLRYKWTLQIHGSTSREESCPRICAFMLHVGASSRSHLEGKILDFELMRFRQDFGHSVDTINMQLGVILGRGEHNSHVGRVNYWMPRGTVTGRILRWPPRLELPGVHTLHNFLLLDVCGTWGCDGSLGLWHENYSHNSVISGGKGDGILQM